VSRTDLTHVRVLDRYDEVADFLPAICEASDTHRDALGFVPRSVFQEFARQHEIFVLTVENEGKLVYAGHLLFVRRYPRAKVLQLLVLRDYRRQKYGRLLCERLVERLTREGFTSIYARVGEDMRAANEAWQAMGFRVQRTEPGGVTTKRTIVVRVRELDSPQLFPTQRANQGDPLGLFRTLSTETPLFLLDLNVLFDLSPRRARHNEALTLFQAERANFCKLAISEEVIDELARTQPHGRPDPMMNLARTFTRFPVSSVKEDGPIILELAQLVFPNTVEGRLSQNDRSDIRHLVTAIENNLAGLVTSDEAILAAARDIGKQFGVQVLSPKAFLPDESTSRSVASFETSCSSLDMLPTAKSDETELRPLLMRAGLTALDLASGWLTAASTSYVVRSESRLVAFVSWPVMRYEGATTIRAAIDESVPNAAEVARGVIMHAMNLNVRGPIILQLRTPHSQSILREVASRVGFCSVKDTSDLNKLAFDRVATICNWHQVRSQLAETCGLKMDTQFPIYRRIEQQIPYAIHNGDSGFETLERIETLLSPALFCFPGRPAVITPIRHEYSNLLLGHSRQGTFLPASTSQLFHEKHFISGPNAFNHLKRGTLMLFYESNSPRGKGELVAVARVRRSYLKDIGAFEAKDLTQSVLNEQTVAQIGRAEVKCVTVFDNVFSLPKPISLRRLQQLECGQPNDLITTHPISDTQLQAILVEAFRA
jgi:GNAT superfamily N-acetyltransferase/predicted nucleic acid-binding protein